MWLGSSADSGIVSSWDFSRAEQKAEEVQAAKAARGRARQHRAEKHSSRVAQQREKAALALAALQARHPDAKGSAAASTDGGTPEPAVSGAVHSQAAAHAAEQTTATLPTAEECSVSNSTCDGVQESCQQQEDTHGIQGRGLIELAHVHSLPMLVSGCTPCSVSEADSAGKPTQNYPCAVSEARPIPLRRYASAAGAPHLARTVPSPLLPNCISDCRQNSPNSMASWQIVRPRPVQRDRSSFKASAHVHAQA